MGLYRKRPIQVEAFQFTGNMQEPGWPPAWLEGEHYKFEHGGTTLVISTREGKMRAKKGDWLVKEPFPTSDRKFYPVKEVIFDATYEES